MIWNGIDAEATQIEVHLVANQLGAATEVRIQDNGHGMDPKDIESFFLTEGDSHKKAKRFSEGIQRPLHGQFGRGRLLIYSIAETVSWSTVASVNGQYERTNIVDPEGVPPGFEIFDPDRVAGPAGTTVTLRLRDTQKAAKINDDDFELYIVERLAESLFALGEVSITWRGQALDPQDAIGHRYELPLREFEPAATDIHSEPKLFLIEWNHDTGSKTLQLCDENGSLVTSHRLLQPTPVPFSWTAYLRWSGFRDSELMNVQTYTSRYLGINRFYLQRRPPYQSIWLRGWVPSAAE